MERTWIFGNPGTLKMLRSAIIGSTFVSAIVLIFLAIKLAMPVLYVVAAVVTITDILFIWKIEFLFGITLMDRMLTINKRVYSLDTVRAIHLRSSGISVKTAHGKTWFVITTASTQFEKNKIMLTEFQNILMETCNIDVTMDYVHERSSAE